MAPLLLKATGMARVWCGTTAPRPCGMVPSLSSSSSSRGSIHSRKHSALPTASDTVSGLQRVDTTTTSSSGSKSSTSSGGGGGVYGGRDERQLLVQWYPGHIAAAERQLREQLRRVDVALEVRDARIPAATTHPRVASWLRGKRRLLVLNRKDMVSTRDVATWNAHYLQRARGGSRSGKGDAQEQEQEHERRVYWTNAQSGEGTRALRNAALAVGKVVNARRATRGLAPRPVRACVIGFPNVGKSALINRLLGRRACPSAPVPGVTRSLRWVRLGGGLDLLDAPGIIPSAPQEQGAAVRLAACNDIGGAAYHDSAAAAALLGLCQATPALAPVLAAMTERYGVDAASLPPESFVVALAERTFLRDVERAGTRVLTDYRRGVLGWFALEQPPQGNGDGQA